MVKRVERGSKKVACYRKQCKYNTQRLRAVEDEIAVLRADWNRINNQLRDYENLKKRYEIMERAQNAAKGQILASLAAIADAAAHVAIDRVR